jgi:hypothetical protein
MHAAGCWAALSVWSSSPMQSLLLNPQEDAQFQKEVAHICPAQPENKGRKIYSRSNPCVPLLEILSG